MSAQHASVAGRAALIYNPIKVDFTSLSESVLQRSEAAGWSTPLFLPTAIEDLGQGVTRQALQLGATHVLVAGGDGTVRAVAEALVGTGVPLTIVPSGTGNLLARNLQLPLGRPHDVIQATFTGQTSPTDVGMAEVTRVDGSVELHAFVVMAGIGLDAAMIQNTEPKLKKRVGWVAYLAGAARSLPSAHPFRATYALDGLRTHHAKVQSILFANCGQLPAGITLIPDASIADGMLDFAVFRPRGAFGWLFVWRRVWWDNSVLHRFRAGRKLARKRSKDSTHVHYLQGTALTASVSEPKPIELDGDEFGEAVRLRCYVEPGSLTVSLPATGE